MNIYLIRHTKVDVKPQTCYGQTDVDVAETFTTEAKQVKEKLKDIEFCKIYSSPLKRCRKLSEFIFEDYIKYDKRLMELDFGSWEMQEWDKITDLEYKTWMDNYIHLPCLNGESFIDLHNRVSNFWQDIRNSSTENIAIVAHAGSIRSLLVTLNNEKLENAFNFNVDYGEVIKIIK